MPHGCYMCSWPARTFPSSIHSISFVQSVEQDGTGLCARTGSFPILILSCVDVFSDRLEQPFFE